MVEMVKHETQVKGIKYFIVTQIDGSIVSLSKYIDFVQSRQKMAWFLHFIV